MTEEANVCMEILRKAAHIGSSFGCQDCPAYAVCPTGTAGWNNECILETAADLIESLSAELEQVKQERDGLNILLTQAQSMLDTRTRERDAAVEALRDAAFCGDCEHYAKSSQEEPCKTCMNDPYCSKPYWQWRGVKEDAEG